MSVWGAPEVAREARHVIGEVNERFIRTGGDNRIHISRFKKLVEAPPTWKYLRRPERNPEETAIAEVICTVVAHELIQDGDTIQIGTGTVSAALAPFLTHRRDLGVHSELIFGGIPTLVEQGVVTGARKTVHPGKVVGASFGPLEPHEWKLVDGNPAYELYCMSHTNDIRVIAAHDRMVAVNNALQVDVTGQINGESLGPTIYSGIGGAFAFPVGGAARQGRAVDHRPALNVGRERRTRVAYPGGAPGGKRRDGAPGLRRHRRDRIRHRATQGPDPAQAHRRARRHRPSRLPSRAAPGSAPPVRCVGSTPLARERWCG
jgi:4-hydroxybutyrate CoA-transferase